MQFQPQGKPSVGVVFDADLGNNIEDVLALASLYGFQGKNESRVVAVSTSKPTLNAAIFADVLKGAIGLTGVGAVIGLAGALACGRLIAGLLFETRVADPTTLALVVAVTMALAVAAGIVPARRAMSVDPMVALRQD